jgi:hypothetical protein
MCTRPKGDRTGDSTDLTCKQYVIRLDVSVEQCAWHMPIASAMTARDAQEMFDRKSLLHNTETGNGESLGMLNQKRQIACRQQAFLYQTPPTHTGDPPIPNFVYIFASVSPNVWLSEGQAQARVEKNTQPGTRLYRSCMATETDS